MKDAATVPAVGFAAAMAILLTLAWLLMLLVGVWHAYNPAVPAIGFSDATFAVAVGRLLTASAAGSKK